MGNRISVIIPNYNGGRTIQKCLESVLSSRYEDYEVIVVDDNSDDDSVSIIKKFSCKLIQLTQHSGASKARNTGAQQSTGKILFFIDSDCLLKEDTLEIVNRTYNENGINTVIGGTYAQTPYDTDFYSIFQSAFIHYSETKSIENPDYIATHAMVIDAEVFKKSGGFAEDFLPILEDVEFSHRVRKDGYRLLINPDIEVLHIFHFSLKKSLMNALRKSRFWTMYSLKNKDVLADSGTASQELKINVFSFFLNVTLLALAFTLRKTFFLYLIVLFLVFNIFVNRGLLMAFHKTGGRSFAFFSSLYYLFVYPLAVGAGTVAGIMQYSTYKNKI